MLFGQTLTSINAKGQLVLPSYLATSLPEKVFITQGLDRNLLLFPEKTFEYLYEQLKGLNLADPKARILLRTILGSACELIIDPANHLELPGSLKIFANVDSQAVLIGQGSFMEIWNPTDWRTQELSYQDVEADPERFCNFNIAFG